MKPHATGLETTKLTSHRRAWVRNRGTLVSIFLVTALRLSICLIRLRPFFQPVNKGASCLDVFCPSSSAAGSVRPAPSHRRKCHGPMIKPDGCPHTPSSRPGGIDITINDCAAGRGWERRLPQWHWLDSLQPRHAIGGCDSSSAGRSSGRPTARLSMRLCRLSRHVACHRNVLSSLPYIQVGSRIPSRRH